MPAASLHLPLEVALADGTPLLLRLGTPEDRSALVAGFERLSPESRLSRFFTAMPKLSPLFLDRLVDVDGLRHVAVGAWDRSKESDVGHPADGLGVGVGRYIVSDDDPTRAELAVAVIDEYQGRGIGRLLLEAVIAEAFDNGVTTVTATVLSSNEAMLSVLAGMGATLQWDPDDRTVFELEIPIGRDQVDGAHLHAVLGYVAGLGRTSQ